MPLQDGNGRNTFVRAEVIRLDSRDSQNPVPNTFVFPLSDSFHQVTGLELQEFFMPESFFSQFSQKNNKIDIQLQNPLINGGQPKIVTAEIPLVKFQYRRGLNPETDMFSILYKSLRIAVSRDIDFGGKVDILPVFNSSRKLAFVCRTMPFLPSSNRTSYSTTFSSSLQVLSAQDIYLSPYLLESNLQTEDLTKFYPAPDNDRNAPVNSTECTFLFSSGPNREESAASKLGFLQNDTVFLDYSPYGISKSKSPVLAAASSNRPVSGTFSSVDGVALAVGDRILLKNQTSMIENGIYVVLPGFLKERAADFKVGDSVGLTSVLVLEGTDNGGKSFLCRNTEPFDKVGDNAIIFQEFFPIKLASAASPLDLDTNRFVDVFAKEISETEPITRIFFPRLQTEALTKQQELAPVRLLQKPIRELRTLTIILKSGDQQSSFQNNAPFFLNFRVYTIDSSVSAPLAIVQKRVNFLS